MLPEELEKLVCSVAPPESNEGTNVAKLIGRVRVPVPALATSAKVIPGELERAFQGSRKDCLLPP
jgi:hypothetical protein